MEGLGEPRRALDDMNKVVELNPDPFSYFSRAEVFRHLGEYERRSTTSIAANG